MRGTPADRPAGSHELDDEALMLAYAQGDAAAFDALYARHRGGVYRYLARQCHDRANVDELFQDVWSNVIRARSGYAPSAKFSTWLYTLARNRLVDHWRATGSRGPHASLDDDGGSGDSGDTAGDDGHAGSTRSLAESIAGPRVDQPEVRAEASALGASIARALAELPPAQREAFLLQQEGGLSLEEIGRITGAGTETVKSRLRYAVGRLRAALSAWQARP